jgi:two-component system cell cycle sensor histidine kinase/response regulator CckA
VSTMRAILQKSAARLTERFTAAGPEPLSILVVDDEESILRYADRVLSGAGYRTTLAGDGADAVRIARANRIDLLLTDVMMPEMTGHELARRLRQDTPGLKVLYMTGYSDKLFQEKNTLWADESFLDKPCSPGALLEAVSLAITGRIGPDKPTVEF